MPTKGANAPRAPGKKSTINSPGRERALDAELESEKHTLKSLRRLHTFTDVLWGVCLIAFLAWTVISL